MGQVLWKKATECWPGRSPWLTVPGGWETTGEMSQLLPFFCLSPGRCFSPLLWADVSWQWLSLWVQVTGQWLCPAWRAEQLQEQLGDSYTRWCCDGPGECCWGGLWEGGCLSPPCPSVTCVALPGLYSSAERGPCVLPSEVGAESVPNHLFFSPQRLKCCSDKVFDTTK